LDDTLKSLASERNLEVIDIPTLDELLELTVDSPPRNIAYCPELADPFVVLHTSGSTGPPKVVNVTHGLYATLDFHQYLATGDQRLNVREWAGRELFITLPPFHAAGLNFFGWSVFHGTILILGPSDQPPSVSTIERALDLGLAKAGVVAPSILEEFVGDSCALPKIARWSSVSFGGGPLSRAAGDVLWENTRVHNLLGSTEMNTLPEFAPASKDEWLYHNFHPSLGIEFRQQQDDLHELVIVRHSRWRTEQAIFWTFPQLDEYCTKDLYEQHPDKPSLWAYRGRVDDIIVLSNGEKFCPAEAESIMNGHPDVKSAMILGNTHAQSALLVELFNPAIKDEHFEICRRSILHLVGQANKTLPQHAQIHASHIKILPPSKSFLRSSKGEVRRAPTVALLNSEISELYASADTATSCSQGASLNFRDRLSLISSLTDVLSEDPYLGRTVDPDTNIFQCGFDSLKVARLLRHIKISMSSQGLQPVMPITPKTIYQKPSPLSLATALLQSVHGCPKSNSDAARESEMSQMLRFFSQKIETIASPPGDSQTVVLTGSTGSLGSYILDRLVRSTRVKQVICLNRASSGAERQAAWHNSRGLTTDFTKVLFLGTDFTKDGLGLDEDVYQRLASRTTLIIHNAWPVDFNLSLSSFEPQLAGCLHLLTLARRMPNLQDLSFISSVGVASEWSKRQSHDVPESKIEDLSVAGDMGYSQSKLLAELIFAHGCDNLKLPVSICRVGQIAGPVLSSEGMWSPREWFPSIMLTCKHLGKIPMDLGTLDCMDWIPVDILADALTEALLPDQVPKLSGKTRYMHFVNPRKAYWSDMAHMMSSKLESDQKLEVVAFTDWLDSLAEVSEKLTEVDGIPAVKLLDFLREMAQHSIERTSFSTRGTECSSPTLKKLPPVSTEWMEHWLNQWKEC
jgi:thioester reductase-like protein